MLRRPERGSDIKKSRFAKSREANRRRTMHGVTSHNPLMLPSYDVVLREKGLVRYRSFAVHASSDRL